MEPGEKPTILIVEDEENVAESYELYLQSEFDVRIALNGGEALVALEPEIDVILLDRRMPGMSGDEVLEHITDWNRDCRVIMVTAVDPDVDIVEMPFDDYLSKPVSKDELQETIERTLLLDEYEALISEYNSVTRTYATLKSQFSKHELEESDQLEQIESDRERLRDEIQGTIDRLADEEMAEVFRDVHRME